MITDIKRRLAQISVIICILLSVFICVFSSQAWADPITFGVGTTKGTTTGSGRTGNGSLTCTLPAGWTSGQFALLILYSDQGTGSAPTGWTQVSGSPWGSSVPKLQAFWRILVSGDANPTTTISGSSLNISHVCNIATYNNVNMVTPVEGVGFASNGSGTPMTADGITTLSDGAFALGLCGRGDNENASEQTFNASATGITERLDGGTGAGNDAQISMYDKEITTAGATGNGSATTSATDPWVSVIIALKPSIPPDFNETFNSPTGYDNIWTETLGTPNEDLVKGAGKCSITMSTGCIQDVDCPSGEICIEEQRLECDVTGTNQCITKLAHSSASNKVFQCVDFYVDSVSSWASGYIRYITNGYEGDGMTFTYTSYITYDGSNYNWKVAYWAGSNQYLNITYALTQDKWYIACIKHDVSGTDGIVEGKLYDVYGNLLASDSDTITNKTGMRTGVRSWNVGAFNSQSSSLKIRFDNFTVDTLDYDIRPFNYGTCYSLTQTENSDNCAFIYKQTCDSDSTFDFPVLTRWTGSDYSACGTTEDTRHTFPLSAPDGVEQKYNEYALEITQAKAPTTSESKAIINYFASLPVSRKVYVYNDAYPNYSFIDGSGNSDAVQIIQDYRTGTGTTNVGDTDNGTFIFILPPNFDIDRATKYPIVSFQLGTSNTLYQALYDVSNGDRDRVLLLLQLVAESVSNGGIGIIGMISNTGGEYSQCFNNECLDAFDDAIQFLYANFNGNRDKVVLFGGSRGGGSSLMLAANPLGYTYTVIGVFVGAPPTAIGSHSKGEDTNCIRLQFYYPYLTGDYTFEDYTLANTTWKYSSSIPPHCTSISTCGDNYAAIASSLVNTTVVSTADANSPIGYCTPANCATYFGNDTKYILLSYGTHDGIIPLSTLLKFDRNMEEAGVNHKTCIYFRGGHGGEYTKCMVDELEYFVETYLITEQSFTPPDGRVYWYSDPDTHLPFTASPWGSESEGIQLPFMANIPSVIDNSIDDDGNNSPYTGYQQPAQILVAGENGKAWRVEILDSSHQSIADQSPTKIWSGTFGTNSCGDGCTCLDYDDEWCIIGSVTPGQGIQYECTSPPCTYYYLFKYGAVGNLLPVSSFYTPFKERVGMHDPFDRINNSSLGIDWTEDTSYLEIYSNYIRSNASGYGLAHHKTPLQNTNYSQWAKWKIVDNSQLTGIILRSNDSSGYRYAIRYLGGYLGWDRYNWNILDVPIDSEAYSASNNTVIGTTIKGSGTSTIVQIWINPSKNTPYSVDYWDSVSDTPDFILTDQSSQLGTYKSDDGMYIGIIAQDNANAKLDDFYGGDFPSTTVNKEAQTKVVDYQPTVNQMLMSMSGNTNWNLNTGICQLPSCGDNVCSAFETYTDCPEDCRKDDFNRADGDDIGSSWWVEDDTGTDLQIVSQTLSNLTTSTGIAHWKYPNADVTQYAKFKISSLSGAGEIGLIFRSEASSGHRYALVYDDSAQILYWYLYDWNTVDGVDVHLVSLAGSPLVAGDTLSATVQGTGTTTVIKVWKNTTNNYPYNANNWDSANDPYNYYMYDDSGKLQGANQANTGLYTGVIIKKEASYASPSLDDWYSGDITSVSYDVTCALAASAGITNTNNLIMNPGMTLNASASVANSSIADYAVNLSLTALSGLLNQGDISANVALILAVSAQTLQAGYIDIDALMTLSSAVSQAQTGGMDYSVDVVLSSIGQLVLTGAADYYKSLTLNAIASISPNAVHDMAVDLSLSAVADLQNSNLLTAQSAAILNAAAQMIPVGNINIDALLQLAASTSQLGESFIAGSTYDVVLVLTAITDLIGQPNINMQASLDLSALNDFMFGANIEISDGLSLSSIASMSEYSALIAHAALSLIQTGNISSVTEMLINGILMLSGSSSMEISGGQILMGETILSSNTVMNMVYSIIKEGILILSAQGNFDTAAQLSAYGGLILQGIAEIDPSSIQEMDVSLILEAIATAVMTGDTGDLEAIIKTYFNMTSPSIGTTMGKPSIIFEME